MRRKVARLTLVMLSSTRYPQLIRKDTDSKQAPLLFIENMKVQKTTASQFYKVYTCSTDVLKHNTLYEKQTMNANVLVQFQKLQHHPPKQKQPEYNERSAVALLCPLMYTDIGNRAYNEDSVYMVQFTIDNIRSTQFKLVNLLPTLFCQIVC